MVIFISFKCPRQESNLHFSLRRAVSYPLNDEGDCRILHNIAFWRVFSIYLEFQKMSKGGNKGIVNLFLFEILQ